MNHVILVPGAWHGAWCFDKVVAELRARGVAVTALNMPGHGGDPEPLGGLEADVASTRNAIQRVGGPVVLLGHSYGGAVITEAAVDPATAARVKHLVYLAAFAPGAGESVGYWSVRNEGSTLRALIRKSDTTEAASVVDTSDFAAAKEAFYADCSDDDVRSAAGQLCPQRTAGLSTPLTGEPWRTLPTTYVVCTEDRHPGGDAVGDGRPHHRRQPPGPHRGVEGQSLTLLQPTRVGGRRVRRRPAGEPVRPGA